MFLFLHETLLGQLSLELAQDLLLRQTLLVEIDQCINLLGPRDALDTDLLLPVELIDEHLY